MGAFFSGVITIFSRLVDHSIEISALICLIFLVKWIAAKKLPSWWHYSLWLMLLVRMLIPIEFENSLNVFNFIPDIKEHQVFEVIIDSPSENEIQTAEVRLLPSPNGPNWRFLLKNAAPVVWFTGALLFGICILFKSISFWRNVRRIPPITDLKALHLLAQCKSRMKIRTAIDVVVTDQVRSPALFGYFHPRLLLPKGIFERLSDEDLSYAFMHELGHLKRHDIGVSWLGAVLQTVYWFNPLVWVAFYQMRIDQEAACDESVLSHIKRHQSADYAKAIVGFLEKFYQNCQLPSLAGVMENKTQMKRRIANIVYYKKYSQKLTAAAVALFISTGFILYSFTGVAKVKQAQTLVTPEAEKPFPAEATSVVGRGDIFDAEIIPSSFFTVQSEIASKPDYLVPIDISHSMDEGDGTREIPQKDQVESSVKEVFSQYAAGDTDEPTPVDRERSTKEPEVRPHNNTAIYTAENSTDTNRVVEKPAELSAASEDSGGETRQPAVMVTEQKPEGEEHKEQSGEKKFSTHVMASLEPEAPSSIFNGSFPMKSSGDFTDKSVIETSHNVSFLENDPDESSIRDGLQEGSIAPNPSPMGVVNRPKTVVSADDVQRMASASNEIFLGKADSQPTVQTDRGKDSDAAGYLVSDVDIPPKVIRALSPQYPYKARRDKIAGHIKLRFIVTKDGEAIDTTVVESSPEGVFDKSVLEALESCRFKPGMKDGKAVDVQVSLPFKFTLS